MKNMNQSLHFSKKGKNPEKENTEKMLEEQTNDTVDAADQGYKKRKKETFGWPVTVGLFVVLALMIICLWALFISGPARLHDEQVAEVRAQIEEQVPGIQSLNEHKFDYVTWQGNSDDTLYWFDVTGQIITTRPLSSLNYNEARKKALESWDLDAQTAFLAYGYSGPVYQLESDDAILMLDYDTLEWVYERNLNHANPQ
ncbi:hypothetical protein [Allobaculum mucilyticum]|uniref:hypothetical protein n=1 Tax=Allobaculum mucilyticum TaxID=2834459 RepID=UPI001E65B93E|nr:hypothetical protein [Allobaculum mucilyticum]UNT95234.1 hypothetical protein KWG62_07680 [Allobaculum mucilyticum]